MNESVLQTTDAFETWWKGHPIAKQCAEGKIIWAMIGFKEVAWHGWKACKDSQDRAVQEISNELTELNEQRMQG